MTANTLSRRSALTLVGSAALASTPVVALAAVPESVPDFDPVRRGDFNMKAMVKRFEFLLDTLRTRYICNGWSMDEELGQRVLAELKTQTEEDPPSEDFLKFIFDHGQSLDWLADGWIVSYITGAASLSKRAEGTKD
jgi:hypothetical protein